MRRLITTASLLAFTTLLVPEGRAQEPEERGSKTFAEASRSAKRDLDDALDELSQLRKEIAEQKVPLVGRLGDLESELTRVRGEFQETTRLLDSRTLDLTNLQRRIKEREDEATYVSNLLNEYIRNFESRLHIAELQRYDQALERAKLAPENSNLSKRQVFQAQAGLLDVALDRLLDALGGSTFTGTAVDSRGLVRDGTFVLVGPAAIFRSSDGKEVGTAEQRLGSLEPAELLFADPEEAAAATRLITTGHGFFPLDPTLGNAHKVEATHETLLQHIERGGVVMIPIFALAGAALLVALYKWLVLFLTRTPSKKRIRKLFEAVADRDEAVVQGCLRRIHGPVGKMLAAGVEHIHEPRELIEEVMYEKVLSTKLHLNRFLPFVSICAASAPLLGLLGTVTGIINTFKMITVFGASDVKQLSGGISEALITTEFGLIVAIPALLLHAFLSRKARGITSKMETTAIRFANQVAVTPWSGPPKLPQEPPVGELDPEDDEMIPITPLPRPELSARVIERPATESLGSVREQLKREILGELLGSMREERTGAAIGADASRS